MEKDTRREDRERKMRGDRVKGRQVERLFRDVVTVGKTKWEGDVDERKEKEMLFQKQLKRDINEE